MSLRNEAYNSIKKKMRRLSVMDKISIIIPCFNEEDALPIYYDEMKKVMDIMKKQSDFELIFVDDGSSDRTYEIMKELHRKDGRCQYLSFSRNFGKEAAIYAGLQNAGGNYAAIMDVDLQDPPSLLPEMYRILKEEAYDSVATRRSTRKGEPKIRSFLSKEFYNVINKISRTEIVSGARDYRLMNRKMVDAVLEMSEYNRFSKGIFGWVGFHTEWLEFEHEDRCAGTSKWPLRKLLAYSIDGITGFSVAPLSLASVMGVLFFLISMILIVFIIVRTLLFGDPVAGWPSMACILFLVSGVQLFCTGIVGIYLSKTYLETKHRPIYLLKETSEETVKMHSVQPVKKQESAAKRRKDAHTAEKKNVYFPEYADKRHASERGEIRA